MIRFRRAVCLGGPARPLAFVTVTIPTPHDTLSEVPLLKLDKKPALLAHRPLVKNSKAAYLFCSCSKIVKYSLGRSRIVYIGSTSNVVSRIPVSAGERAHSILNTHGISGFAVFVVSCQPVQKGKTWRKLERALLIRFRERYGRQPLCNTAGKKLVEHDEFAKYFSRAEVDCVLDRMEGKSLRA